MATVKPFKAIRPDAKYADKVISLPYDVMNRREAAEMAAENPYSFLHICRAEIDLPEQEDAYDRSVYEKARFSNHTISDDELKIIENAYYNSIEEIYNNLPRIKKPYYKFIKAIK